MGYIYFIHQENTDYWKIGRTKKPADRLRKHRTSNFNITGFTALFEVENDVASERFLMKNLEKYRLDDREFFELPIDELKSIENKILGIKNIFYSQKFLSIINDQITPP